MKAKFAMVPLWCALAGLGASSATAETACKGLSQQACDGSQSCSWVDAYVRKDGREVASYCRSRPAPKPAAERVRDRSPAAG